LGSYGSVGEPPGNRRLYPERHEGNSGRGVAAWIKAIKVIKVDRGKMRKAEMKKAEIGFGEADEVGSR